MPRCPYCKIELVAAYSEVADLECPVCDTAFVICGDRLVELGDLPRLPRPRWAVLAGLSLLALAAVAAV